MNMLSRLTTMGIIVLSMGMVVGCAQQQQKPVAEPTAAKQAGPDAQAAEKAIADAKDAIAKAKENNWIWRDTEKFLKEAEKDYKAGKYEDAIKKANKAKDQANLAVEQYQKEQQMDRGLRFQKSSSGNSGNYKVVRGDSLWKISGKPEIYSDPYQWPLIYKTNADKIKDADLIFPGQQFAIDTSPSSADVDAAVRHAKTRGAWTIGQMEDSDRAYLGR